MLIITASGLKAGGLTVPTLQIRSQDYDYKPIRSVALEEVKVYRSFPKYLIRTGKRAMTNATARFRWCKSTQQ